MSEHETKHEHEHEKKHEHQPAPAHGSDHAHAGAHAAPAAPAAKPHADPLGRRIGITMAMIGALLAFSTALVGAERTELVAAMVEQTNVAGQYQTVSTKHRVLETKLREMHARMPEKADLAAAEERLKAIDAEAAPTPGAASGVRFVRVEARDILDTLTPVPEDVDRFAWLVIKFADQRDAAREWAESYDGAIEAHEAGAERYELGQILAEVGIVASSIAMLYHTRKVWGFAMLLGAGAGLIVLTTWLDVSARVHRSAVRTENASRSFVALSSEAADDAVDEELVKEIEAIAKR
jgi:hypothetical protein